MPRAFLIVIDSLGCGGAPDAALFGDEGADTLGHVAKACAEGRADSSLRRGPLHAPHLISIGLGRASALSTGDSHACLAGPLRPGAAFGCAIELSPGKDTPSGHWELAGAPLREPFGLFPHTIPALPQDLVADLVREGGLPGVIGNRHAAGVALIGELGEAHLSTGKPIVYTSVDSVLQIAAHEEAFGLQRLYDLCRIARRLVDPLRIGRVIARPFVGADTASFRRTAGRRDFAMPAPDGNILDRAAQDGRAIATFGKIGDIFGHRNTGRAFRGAHDMELFDRLMEAAPALPDDGLAFANFVDLDSDHGHLRDVAGYAAGVEALDRRLGEFLAILREGDLCVVTADHGNDPTWTGADHTRENAPVLACLPGAENRELGRRETFADVGASIARHLGLRAPAAGRSWL
jgi:phosphopentomutase